MYQYPYGNAQQLNLDWILSKLQELESGSGGGADLEEVANALVSASFDDTNPYRRYDYAFYDGKLYRALNDNIGAFNPADWMEVTLGADIPVLTRLVNADSALITTLQNTVQNLGSDDVANESTVTGNTVTDALGNLNSAISDVQGQISAYVETGNTATKSGGYAIDDFVVWKGSLYKVISTIPQNATFTPNTNIKATNVNEQLTGLVKYAQQTISGNNIKAIRVGSIVNFTIANGSFTADENHHLIYNNAVIRLDETFRPPFNIELWDTYSQTRVVVEHAGYLYSTITQTTSMRLTGCWIAADATI